jgi:preprotein translocase SecE subunit
MAKAGEEVFFYFGGNLMARVGDGASGSALGKTARVSPAGPPAPGGVPAKGAERAKAVDRARPARVQVRRLSRLWSVAVQYITDVRAEMNRVAWPDRQTVIASTVVVIFVLIVTAAYLAGWDYIFAEVFNVLVKR